MRHGGRLLVDQLAIAGTRAIFTVPGESFLAALDGLYDHPEIRPIVCRQEGGAAMMAEAYGKMTGTPGVCFVTRGPGAANAMSGLHVAQQDSTPMILLLGLPASDTEDRESFQEIDVKRLFSSFVKWAAVVREVERIPEYVSRAFHVSASGRPGPVVLGLPEDVLAKQVDAADMRPLSPSVSAADPGQMAAALALIGKAERPLIIVGGPLWTAETGRRIAQFARTNEIPVAAAFRAQDYVDNRDPAYVGHLAIGPDPKLAEAVKSADVLLVLGARLGEITTSGYELVTPLRPAQKLIHVHPSPDELNTVYRADLAVAAPAASFVSALPADRRITRAGLGERQAALRQAYEASRRPVATPGAVRQEEVILHLSAALPDDAIVCNGAGNYAAFLHRYFSYRNFRQCLAPTSGSMGYGLPAAIAAKIAAPDRTVVAVAGDGCFLMTGQELATAHQHGLKLTVIVINNGIYGTIRMHQERTYPGRVLGTTLKNPDFAALAQAFGGRGERVTQTEQFPAALKRALAHDGPALIEVVTDVEAITPTRRLSDLGRT